VCHRGQVLVSSESSEARLASLDHLRQFAQRLMPPGGSMIPSDHHLGTLSPVALAYVGDAVYELFVREALLFPPKRIRAYHQQVVDQVKAERQAHYLQQLIPVLTEAEQDMVRRGRNASSSGPKRLTGQTYQQATGFETLIGYLYLTNLDRLMDLLGVLQVTTPEPLPPEPDVSGS
jgi:ribonuclease-3 family protein